jgi:hypothetical protein
VSARGPVAFASIFTGGVQQPTPFFRTLLNGSLLTGAHDHGFKRKRVLEMSLCVFWSVPLNLTGRWRLLILKRLQRVLRANALVNFTYRY